MLNMGEYSGYFYQDTSYLEELTDIHLELNSFGFDDGALVVEDDELKLRIAFVALKIIRNTFPAKKEILNTAYDLSVFSDFDFRDGLSDIFEDIKNLVNDRSLDKRDIIYRWKNIEKDLEEYLVS